MSIPESATMTYLFNDPTEFTDELIEGFAAAYPQWVRRVRGGVVRAAETPPGQVALVTGGGSGHYPAFAGIVGPGLAHGAAMGNIFASPSATQVYNVAKAAHAGGGVLLTYGNYAGDVLNFGQAQERLRSEGIECHTVLVTDDIASAPSDELEKRRGIAGDLVVLKAAAAAAEARLSLDEVARAARNANARTRTLGVAFSGCTLPGSDHPLFTVPRGRMGVGMGIHGEPGISEEDIPSAADLARMLVSKVLKEAPSEGGKRIAVLLNGLGGVKYEELFVLYGTVARELNAAGYSIVEPDVGELVTSFQMAGVSLTLTWLDDDLERYWKAPASTPAYRKGTAATGPPRPQSGPVPEDQSPSTPVAVPAAAASRELGPAVVSAFTTVAQTVEEHVDMLGALDSVAGDGDHGIGMQRGAAAGLAAGREAASAGAGVGSLLTAAGQAWADKAGGTSGALWGLILRTAGERLGDEVAPTTLAISAAIQAATEAVCGFGKARVGDKTMVDALAPFAQTFERAAANGGTLGETWAASAHAAQTAAEQTAALVPRLGRARAHGHKSLGTADPGAVSFALIAAALAHHISESTEQENS